MLSSQQILRFGQQIADIAWRILETRPGSLNGMPKILGTDRAFTVVKVGPVPAKTMICRPTPAC
ncbi:hypothetical protein SAE02_61480 [Skermanella aerolata]|uniref:Uncharacterized protein n=1 Tax=Skermanella aerolata TaxID=393310 RepID=A0A512E0N4_9PROT|nr:hypothetical protein SAE02_61480 [Skermanella aerolata]